MPQGIRNDSGQYWQTCSDMEVCECNAGTIFDTALHFPCARSDRQHLSASQEHPQTTSLHHCATMAYLEEASLSSSIKAAGRHCLWPFKRASEFAIKSCPFIVAKTVAAAVTATAFFAPS